MNHKVTEIIKKVLLSFIFSVIPVVILLAKFIGDNDPSESAIGYRFLLLIISFTLVLTLLQIFIPGFSKKLPIIILFIIFLLVISRRIVKSYAFNICNEFNGEWRIEVVEQKSGSTFSIPEKVPEGTCYLPPEKLQKVLQEHSFISNNFMYFETK